MKEYVHRINGNIGKSSLSVVLPINILKDLNIVKGDYVEIDRDKDHIVIRKLRMQKGGINIIDSNLDKKNGSKSRRHFNNPYLNNQSLKGSIDKKMIPADQSFEAPDHQVSIAKGEN